MATSRDEELLALAQAGGADNEGLAERLAGATSARMGAQVADRYAALGARWLADPVPTRLDPALVARLERHGFRRESLADVRVHRGPRAQDAAAALGARAFAVGEHDVFFGAGEFDPHSRTGQAVLAHELAHIAPPDTTTPGAAGAGAPLLQTRKRGDEDAAGAEAHERSARDVERRVFAMDDSGPAPALGSAPGGASGAAATTPEPTPIDPAALEAKVMQLLDKWQRGEAERLGRGAR